MDSHIEEIQQRERLEKIQTYRLVRENLLEHQKQLGLNRKELMRLQLNTYENMQVSHNRDSSVWCLKLSVDKVSSKIKQLYNNEKDIFSPRSLWLDIFL